MRGTCFCFRDTAVDPCAHSLTAPSSLTMSWNDDGGFDHSKDREPLFLWRGHPVYAAPFIVVTHVCFLLIALIAVSGGAGRYLDLFAFSSEDVKAGYLWQPITYLFVHDPSGAIGLAIELFLLWAFGRE